MALPTRAIAGPDADEPAGAPDWKKDEVKTLLGRVQAAARLPSVERKDAELARIAGAAYRVPPERDESTGQYAKRVLRRRDPQHPNVKKGQWLTALMRRFYADVAERAGLLARFELDRSDRQFLERMAGEAKKIANQLAGSLEMVVDGLEEGTEPLPAVGGEPPTKRGVLARVHSGGVLTVQRLDRARFEGHRPPEDHPRTKHGALKEVYSAHKQYQTSAIMFGKYDEDWRKNRGHVRALVPAAYPAIYLNEIARAAKEAGMHTLHLLTMEKRGDLRELPLALKKQRRKKKQKWFELSCPDRQPMGECAQRLKHGHLNGRVLYDPK